ncbi:MAG: permease [Planctomycetota bacterium]|nr:permease [Planctomycetota bacterium]
MPFDRRTDGKTLLGALAVFAALYFTPWDHPRVAGAVQEAVALTAWYAREHVLLCLVPAFFIAGAIGVFVSQAAVMRYLGAQAKRWVAYGVASVSGAVLAVCSCTVLPLFGGIYQRGAGLGPATAFLYAGPAINVLAIVMTARVLGWELGVARAVGAVVFAVVIGLLMAFLFRREESERTEAGFVLPDEESTRTLGQEVVFFIAMIGVLVFANWGAPGEGAGTFWFTVHAHKWWITSAFGLGLAIVLVRWFGIPAWKAGLVVTATLVLGLLLPSHPVVPFTFAALALAVITATGSEENQSWFDASWGFAKQIMPLLFGGVLVAGLLLGRPGNEGLIPSDWVGSMVGGNGLGATLFASVAGAFMYFATLTEIPILEGLLGSGMGEGPALALLLAGPALSLPNMLVIGAILGVRKTVAFVALVIVMATVSGLIYGAIV